MRHYNINQGTDMIWYGYLSIVPMIFTLKGVLHITIFRTHRLYRLVNYIV